jgi:hypothetical protein
MATDDSVHLGVRIPKATHDALLDRQKKASDDAGAEVSLAALVRALIEEGLGIRKPKARR